MVFSGAPNFFIEVEVFRRKKQLKIKNKVVFEKQNIKNRLRKDKMNENYVLAIGIKISDLKIKPCPNSELWKFVGSHQRCVSFLNTKTLMESHSHFYFEVCQKFLFDCIVSSSLQQKYTFWALRAQN